MKISKSKKNKSLSKFFQKKLIMNLKTSPFSILNKDRREMNYIKGIYKRKVQAEIKSYKDTEDEDKNDTITIQVQDVLMRNIIS